MNNARQISLRIKEMIKQEAPPNRTRTCDILVNSQTLYQLSYGGMHNLCAIQGRIEGY